MNYWRLHRTEIYGENLWSSGLASAARLGRDRQLLKLTHTHTHTHPFNGPLSGSTQVSRYQKCKTNLDFTEARDSEWQLSRLGSI